MYKDKNIVVTGGSRGIGKAIVEEFAALGGNVIFTYHSNEVAASELRSTLASLYPAQTFISYQCDISQHDQVEEFYNSQLDDLKTIDVVVNNAGITHDGLMLMMQPEQWHQVIQTNLTGTFYLTQKVIFKMVRKKRGSIINISSVAGVYGNAGQCNYAAAKAGMIGMSTSLSKELASRNIRVNVIAPGFIDTDMTDKMSEEEQSKIIEKIGLKKMGQASDVAHAAAFIASDKAGYITGQTLVVDGGLVI